LSRRSSRWEAAFGLPGNGTMAGTVTDPTLTGIARERGRGWSHPSLGRRALDLLCRPMPIYEFECEECGCRFEELATSDTRNLACPECGSERTQRLMSPVSPAGRQPRGASVRSDESRRGEREAARGERLAESKRKRAAGNSVRPSRGGGGK
jgi:putative FmdB family regulatory protein